MTGLITSQFRLNCSICGEAVPIEDCKTDERGKAVHEQCYVRKVVSKFTTAIPARPPENWFNALFLMRGPV